MSNPFDFFDKVYCINLKDREDRWNECLENFRKYKITNYERIEAFRVDGPIHPKRKGQIGCSLSYAVCINKAINEGLKNVLILEDDFEFIFDCEELHERMRRCLDDLPNDWDSIYFGATVGNFYGVMPLEKYSDNLLRLKCGHTTHSIAFSSKGLRRIIKFFENKVDWHTDLVNNYECVDVFFAKEYQKNTESFIASELLCYQRPSRSDIENVIYDYSQWMNTNFNHFKTGL